MKQHLEHDEVEYYYASHPTEEDLMGETWIHAELVTYLKLVLRWQFRGQSCAIIENMNFYQTRNESEYPLAPDLAVIKGVEEQDVRSWKIDRTGPAPQVVFEIASDETWEKDIDHKPWMYARMGVKEYFAFDPDASPRKRRQRRKVQGWQYTRSTGTMEVMALDAQGRLWSQHLESFLVPDGKWLRLYDTLGQRRLTQAEAVTQENEVITQKAESLAQKAETFAREKERLAEKLRSLGINPDEL